eukprot:gnl/TRDRNA2_/TRDRNA2_166349_c1_seq2.p1 gnl/TRDRNA2_/TRDRNA2_166349_c1~~gnl/TRDRNA2_/TRDRNA2_166349_c1_seq2.p1  ORF type:complete len:929 (+),score=145.29 gnl/TRDRNA2_/TRDRNA2_166349_c1_seq2:275-2788(+)
MIGVGPGLFDFSDAYVLEDGGVSIGLATQARRLGEEEYFEEEDDARVVTNADGRRLLWQGFTDNVKFVSGVGSKLTLSFDVGRKEYVRMRVGGIKLPVQGGQALFDIYTSINGLPADELTNCCPETPDAKMGRVFKVAYWVQDVVGTLKNQYQQDAFQYPIRFMIETRFAEMCRMWLNFNMPRDFDLMFPKSELVIVLRTPPGYDMMDELPLLRQKRECSSIEDGDEVEDPQNCGTRALPTVLRKHRLNPGRLEFNLPGTYKIHKYPTDYRATFWVTSPPTLADQDIENGLFVVEVTDSVHLDALPTPWNSPFLGSTPDIPLSDHIIFDLTAPKSPPGAIIVVTMEIKVIGVRPPNQVELYAPEGFFFLASCFEPGQTHLKNIFMSCRERWSLFGSQGRSSAMMPSNAQNGVTEDLLPVKMSFMVSTPAETPESNSWLSRAHMRTGPVAWGAVDDAFVISQMDLSISFAAIATTTIDMFLAFVMRYPLAWGGWIHIQAPSTYEIYCPVRRVLSGPDPPREIVCLTEDPILVGCEGRRHPNEGNFSFEWGDVPCTPKHSTMPAVTGTFEETGTTTTSTSTASTTNSMTHAVPEGTTMLLNLLIRVPHETPRPREENFFKVRVLDPSKMMWDGKLNVNGPQVRSEPVVQNFQMWWMVPKPKTVISVSVYFEFNKTVVRAMGQEAALLSTIEIVAPEGFEMEINRPGDVKRLIDPMKVPVTAWSWAAAVPRSLWFNISMDEDIEGKFHMTFPVLCPAEMPGENLWQVKFCGDMPYCYALILNVPIPGFDFGEQPTFQLDQDAQKMMVGSKGYHTAPSSHCTLLLWLLPLLIHGYLVDRAD